METDPHMCCRWSQANLFHIILVQLIKEPLEGLAIDEAVWELLSSLRETRDGSNKHPSHMRFTFINYTAICTHLNDSLSAVRLHVDSTHDLQKHVHRHSLPEQEREKSRDQAWKTRSETGIRERLDLTHGLQTECWCDLGPDSKAPRTQPEYPDASWL